MPIRVLAARVAMAVLACWALSCAPLTYSETGRIDFSKYRSVRVSVTSTNFLGGGSPYLAAELEEVSGFERVTTNPSEPVDAVLTVTLDVQLSYSDDGEGQTSESYSATAKYSLTAGGKRVDASGAGGSAEDGDVAADNALEQVAADYIAPYRL